MIPAMIGGQPKERDFAGGFIWKRYWPDNWKWIDNALHQCTDEREDVSTDRLVPIEWHFIRLLDEHSQYSPKTLHKHLAHSPEFFPEVLSACFSSRIISDGERESVTSHDKYMAEHAFHLLHDLNYIPGTWDDGSIDEQQLKDWCLKARELAIASGRLEVCDVQIGEMLSRCPLQDGDGSWPCQAIRCVIEAIASDSIASGFHCGISNSRGVVWRGEGGTDERELSTKYRDLANKVRFDSTNTARVLDGVADSYDRQSQWWEA